MRRLLSVKFGLDYGLERCYGRHRGQTLLESSFCRTYFSTHMFGCACIINNLGRRRYPIYWWSPESNWIQGGDNEEEQENLKTLEEGKMRKYEHGGKN